MNETDLLQKGYVQDADGNWHKPRRMGAAAGAVPERSPQAASDGQIPRGPSNPQSMGRRAAKPILRVLIVVSACRGRAGRHDGDNWRGGIEASLKPLRDAIARRFGLDDHESTIQWEYGVIEAEGPEGGLVKVDAI